MNRYAPYLGLLSEALESLDQWRASFGSAVPEPVGVDGAGSGASEGAPVGMVEEKRLAEVLTELATRLEGNYPFHHRRYAGQMLKPPHPVAWLAYALTMSVNPNNHALDGGPPTSRMEKEVVAELAAMMGFPKVLGHLTSGGTIANLEALWIARELHPGKGIAHSSEAHYTHQRVSRVLGMESYPIHLASGLDSAARELESLRDRVGTLVVTLGTTGRGLVEPLHELLPIARALGMRVHVDAAYGGFHKLIAGSLGMDAAAWEMVGEADSLVVDPHKHGLQPYGCGCVLFRDPSVGVHYRHDSPYTYFTSDELHLGEISLECSRAGASAAALWATLKALPLQRETGLGPILAACRAAALELAERIRKDRRWVLFEEPELDIVTWFPALASPDPESISVASQAWFDRKMNDPVSPWFVSLMQVPVEEFLRLHPDRLAPGSSGDAVTVKILRSVLMKPEHLHGLDGLLD